MLQCTDARNLGGWRECCTHVSFPSAEEAASFIMQQDKDKRTYYEVLAPEKPSLVYFDIDLDSKMIAERKQSVPDFNFDFDSSDDQDWFLAGMVEWVRSFFKTEYNLDITLQELLVTVNRNSKASIHITAPYILCDQAARAEFGLVLANTDRGKSTCGAQCVDVSVYSCKSDAINYMRGAHCNKPGKGKLN